MPRLSKTLALALVLASCGGKAAREGTTTTPDRDEPAPACSKTARTKDDEATNAATLEMAAHAKPGVRIPILISLVEVPNPGGAKTDERAAQLEPYQAPIVKRLNELGADGVEQFWLTNTVAASVSASDVSDLLCLANVVRIETNASYWDVVERPWSPDEAGALECPLTGEACPEHCFDFVGLAVDEAAGCYSYAKRERVGCSTTTPGINDGAASCRKLLATGKEYVFFGFVPVEPNFIGWTDCDSAAPLSTCE